MIETREPEQAGGVRLDAGLAHTIISYLREAELLERGGILIGQRDEHGVTVSGAVFPPQLARAGNHCAFDVSGIDTTRQALSALSDPETKRIADTIVGWVHSHPSHGLYLSETDVRTLSEWVQLDEHAIAVVVDPFLRRPPDRQIAWWRGNQRGQHALFGHFGADALTLAQAACLAEAVHDSAVDNGRWDIVVPGCVISVFPQWVSSDPDPQQTAPEEPDGAEDSDRDDQWQT
jgi:proteasome lid subunit RPN8/RPN11